MAASNAGYIATSDTSRVVVTLPASPAVGDRVLVSGAAAAGWEVRANTGQVVYGEGLPRNWKTTLVNPDPDLIPSCIGGDDDLESLFLGTLKFTGALRIGNAFRSTNFGASWARVGERFDGNFFRLTASADGLKVAFAADPRVDNDDQIYTSDDGGVTVTPLPGSPTLTPLRPWGTLLSSADGTRLMLMRHTGGDLFVPTDSGGTWNN